jgi:molecular chaperone GrpE
MASMDVEAVGRALRELDAARARVERDARAVADDTRKQLVAELIPVIDNLDRIIAAGESSETVEGVRMVRAQLEGVLRGYGVERVDVVGARFDPTMHDAVLLREVREPDRHDVVLDQLEPCYRFGSSLLRPAKVVVGRSSSPAMQAMRAVDGVSGAFR